VQTALRRSRARRRKENGSARSGATSGNLVKPHMRTIARRLRQLEERIQPSIDRKSIDAPKLIRERRKRRLEAAVEPFHEPETLPSLARSQMTIAETLRYIRTQRLNAATK
jgi:hypothetical protein